MTSSVNFNPFIKNIQYVDLEKYEEIVGQNNGSTFINGDSQDEENVEIRLMSGNTERNYKNAKKAGMKDEIPNNEDMLKKELQKYIDVYIEDFSKQHPEVKERDLRKFVDAVDDEFIAKYMKEASGSPTIVMSDVVQEFEQFATQKMEQMSKGARSSERIIENESANTHEKYHNLSDTVRDARNRHSSSGGRIDYFEGIEIKDKASDLILSQLLNGNGSIELLKATVPNYKQMPEYQQAIELLESLEGQTDPQKTKEILAQAKQQINNLLTNRADVNDIADFVEDSSPMRGHNNNHSPHRYGCKHDYNSYWENGFSNRYEHSRNQHRLFNAVGEIGLPQGNIRNDKGWFGEPSSSTIHKANREIKSYVRELKEELRHTISNNRSLNQIFHALDRAMNSFDVEEYLRRSPRNVSVQDLVADFIKSAQDILGTQNRIGNHMEEGMDPHNRNLTRSKHLVETAGRHVSDREKGEISRSYSKYVFQALMSDNSNIHLLDSLRGRSFFDNKTFSMVSVDKVFQEIRNLKQNPPCCQSELEEQVRKITKEIEFLLKQMDTQTLTSQIKHQGHNHHDHHHHY